MPSTNDDRARFRYLTVQDLLQAQQIFHSDLFERDNVVATAVGRYRRRVDENDRGPKRLDNTRVDRWSWPCVLVFVDKWEADEEFARKRFHQFVPPLITLPDRRKVPTCVIVVEEEANASVPLFQRLNFPTQLVGGGFPVVRRAQEEDRAGSLGCLVSDGANVFALTNRHVAGPAGSEMITFLNGARRRIGVTHAKQVTKLDVDSAFPGFTVSKGWAAPVTYSNVDAALIEVDDVNEWTAQVYGLGELGELYDLSADTLTLDLIGTPVRAFGAASGELRGEILGFFYRYKTVGSYGYVSDLLIGPRPGGAPVTTIPGDSGTLWCLDDADARPERGHRARRLRPIAMQWGGHVYGAAHGRYQLALATGLSTILRTLDVDIISDWNIGHNEYWGKVGHYKVAATACTLVEGPAAPLFAKNAGSISFADAAIEKDDLNPDVKEFVPLADVADLVWRTTRKKDSANHFADMDQPGKGKFAGKTLLDLTKNRKNIDPQLWVEFYTAIGTDMTHMGALPFRVWQMFDAMVEELKQGNVARYLCAGGLMAHYVGDACQPLHVSQFHHGRPGHPAEEKVHSVYETNMLDSRTLDLVQGLRTFDYGTLEPIPVMNNGFDAAVQVIELMRRTIEHLPPLEVIEAFNEGTGRNRIRFLWDALRERTIHCIADGARTLARMWESAWAAGGGGTIPAHAISRSTLRKLYDDKTFVPSDWLTVMAEQEWLKKPPAAAGTPALPVKNSKPANKGSPKKTAAKRRPSRAHA